MNLAFTVAMSNMYHYQIYHVPDMLDFFRSKPIGALLIFMSLIMFYISIKQFNKHSEDPVPTTPSNLIIVNGIYSYTRNPMYLGLLLMQIGLGMLLSVIHIVMFTVFTYLILKYFVIFPEEKYLEDKFGDVYIRYKKSVNRWI